MRRRKLKVKNMYVSLLVCFALLLILSSSLSAEKKVITHVVKKGDTLWSICEYYYGDPFLWPELWEMNQFITNPHWLKPGDIITLLEYGALKPTLIKKEVEVPAQEARKPLEKPVQPEGIIVSSLTNVEALGFLRQNPFEPWGKIFAFEPEGIMLKENDIVYVKMYKEDVRLGDTFTIYNISNPIMHPLLKKEECGYIHSFKGVLEVEEAKKDYYIARIRDSFRTIYKDDLLMPYHPVSPCVLPIPYQGDLTASILASKDNLGLHGQYSVVYIDSGFKEGVMRGNIFEAIEERASHTDPEKKEIVSLPPTILGRILIMATTENTSTGVVFWAAKNFGNGVTIKPVLWQDQYRELAHLPHCAIE
jgi:hypothetical protein